MIPSGIVSPMVPLWDRGDFEEVVQSYGEFHQSKRDFVRTNLPIIAGTTSVVVPYVVGASLVAFAPHPGLKAIGLSMLVPSPMDAVYFAFGYQVGSWVQDDIPLWLI